MDEIDENEDWDDWDEEEDWDSDENWEPQGDWDSADETDHIFRQLCDRANLLIYELGRPEEALPLLHRALSLAPDDSSVLYLLGAAYLDYASKQLDRYKWLDAGRQLKHGLKFYRAAMRADPNSGETHALRSRWYSVFGMHGRAVKAAHEALLYEPEYDVYHHNLAECLLDSRRYEEAHRAAITARELDPDDVDNHFLLAQIAHKRKLYQDAEEYCRDALAIDPVHTKSLHLLGVVLLAQRRKLEAIERFYEALKLEPNSYTYREDHSKAVRRVLLPDWAGKGFVRLILVGTMIWTVLLYGAVRSLGCYSWLAVPGVFIWGVLMQMLLCILPNSYLSSYRYNLAAEHPPVMAAAFAQKNNDVSLPDAPMFPLYFVWTVLAVFLAWWFGTPLIAFWTSIAQRFGWLSVCLFVGFSTAVFLKLLMAPDSGNLSKNDENPSPDDDNEVK